MPRFVGIGLHPRWFEPDPNTINSEMRAVIDSVPPLEILAALPPPPFPGALRQSRGGNLSFYRPQSEWLGCPDISILPFADYETGLRKIIDLFGGCGTSVEIPKINTAAGPLPALNSEHCEQVRCYYLC